MIQLQGLISTTRLNGTITGMPGQFSGEVTPPTGGGGSGEDGFSPIVGVQAIDGGHRVSITDKNGTQSFDVMDGEDGQPGEPGAPGEPGEPGEPGQPGEPGYTPVKGTDYFTQADKEEIVTAVIEALPTAEGGNF